MKDSYADIGIYCSQSFIILSDVSLGTITGSINTLVDPLNVTAGSQLPEVTVTPDIIIPEHTV